MQRVFVLAVVFLALGALAFPAHAESAWERQAGSRSAGKPASGEQKSSTAKKSSGDKKTTNPDLDKYAFELPVINGSGTLSFEELATSGQATVIFFWLADCPLCHLQMPYVEQLKQLADEHGLPIRVVGINVDQRESDAEDYIAEKKPTFDNLFDGNARRTGTPYSVDDLGCPLVYVFNSNGRFVDYISGFKSNLSKEVLELLDIDMPEKK